MVLKKIVKFWRNVSSLCVVKIHGDTHIRLYIRTYKHIQDYVLYINCYIYRHTHISIYNKNIYVYIYKIINIYIYIFI